MIRGKRWLIVAIAGIGAIASYVVVENRNQGSLSACASLLSGDPHRGGQLYQSRGCNACHPLFGQGPQIAADFAKQPPGGWRPMYAVAAMWSHGPDIWQKLEDARLGYPRISEEDVVDLFSFIGSLQYMDPPGDARNGQFLFRSKQCAHCHGTTDSGNGRGPALSQFGDATPILWAQRMWNHGDSMVDAVAAEGVPWPVFSGAEMADLLVYIQSQADGARTEINLWPADPDNGERLFIDKDCVSCHSFQGSGGDVGPDLALQSQNPRTLVDLASMMWNHAPRMREETQERGLAWPIFEEKEMADLIAFLYQARYFEPQGDAALGKSVFDSKGCSSCHGPDVQGDQVGPQLRGEDRSYCTTKMAYLMWSHGPKMYEKLQEAGMLWEEFSEVEMTHLIAYLNTN